MTISAQPWRLQSIPPGTVDIYFDVPDALDFPRSFNGRMALPLSGNVPVAYTRNGGIQKRKMQVTVLFRPGATQAVDVAALLAVIDDSLGPYLLTLPDGEGIDVLIDPSQGDLGFTWVNGERRFLLAFQEV